MVQLTTSSLKPEEIAQAFALVQLASPTVSYSRWRAHVLGVLDGGDRGARGFLATRDRRRLILGLLEFEITQLNGHGRLMRASNLVTCGASPRHRIMVVLALVGGLEARAKREGCTRLITPLPRFADVTMLNSLSELLCAAGHRQESLGYLKQLR